MMDPEYLEIVERAKSRKGVYRQLVQRLRRKGPKDLREKIQRFHEEAFEEIDCLRCANCCSSLGPRLSELDVSRLGKALAMKPGEFKHRYLMRDEDGDVIFREHPCPLLMEDNRCLVYERRPKACREYPHTDDPKIRSMLKLTLTNSAYCPVVALVFERLYDSYSS